jgi:hypothetical protein
MREMLLGAAGLGHFTPLWSDRIFSEWQHVATKRDPVQGVVASGEIALMRASWPRSVVAAAPGVEARLWLPDATDLHVLATAVVSSADGIITLNAKDFPRNILSEEGLWRRDPDALLHGFWQADPVGMSDVGANVLARANAAGAGGWEIRALLKKAKLPRLAKALSVS